MTYQFKLVEREAFAAAAKDGSTEVMALRKALPTEVKAFDIDNRTVDFVISTAAVDRASDSIAVDGWDYDNFMRSPVVLWCHDSSRLPVGKALSVSRSKSELLSRAEFADRDLDPFADTVFRMYVGKFLSAVSVGFIPKLYSFASDKDRPFGINFQKQELIEYSCCPVPANPEALVAAKAAGIDVAPIREWAAQVLDEGAQILVPRNLLEETFRQAKTPRATRQKYLAKSETADWKVGAARDLPLDDKDGWDGPAAAKRMLDAAGFDGDNPDPEKARRGFLIYDAANPSLRGSYKLPFADIIDGSLKAIKGGVSAAKGRLDQTDAPKAVLDEAAAVVDHYETKVGAGGDKNAPCATIKAGRRISAANKELLQKAMDHHASATDCIKQVLDSNESDEPDQDDPQQLEDLSPQTTRSEEPEQPADKRAQRLAQVAALKASIK